MGELRLMAALYHRAMRQIGVVIGLLLALATLRTAMAAPPAGYRCGKGKAIKDKGCSCPAGQVERRDEENIAECVTITLPPPPPPLTTSKDLGLPCDGAC